MDNASYPGFVELGMDVIDHHSIGWRRWLRVAREARDQRQQRERSLSDHDSCPAGECSGPKIPCLSLQAPNRQMRGAATQAMRDIVEERQRSRWRFAAATL